MNKIIKIRGVLLWNEKWTYGTLLNIKGSYHIIQENDMCYDGCHIKQETDNPTLVKEETIGQFSGLLDKDGKEIYEGDIIIKNNEYYICKWSAMFACFAFIENSKYGEYNYFQECEEKDITLVGNIYDNHYLVKYDFTKDKCLKKENNR